MISRTSGPAHSAAQNVELSVPAILEHGDRANLMIVSIPSASAFRGTAEEHDPPDSVPTN